jgi:hypothetical protein
MIKSNCLIYYYDMVIIMMNKLKTKSKMIDYLIDEKKLTKKEEDLDKYNQEQINFIYRLSESQINKENICDIIFNIFREKNLIFVI